MTDYDGQHWAEIQDEAGVLPAPGARDAWQDYVAEQETEDATYPGDTSGTSFEGEYGERFDGAVFEAALEAGTLPGGAWRAWREHLEQGS